MRCFSPWTRGPDEPERMPSDSEPVPASSGQRPAASDYRAAGGLRIWGARLTGPTARKGVWALADQMLVSGANFATALVLARCTDRGEYGAYVLAFSVMLFLSGLQAALITGPMMVLSPAREAGEFRRYVTSLAALQLATGAGGAALAFAAVGVMSFLPAGESLRGAFAGMATAVFFVQTQEFARRVLLARLAPARAFVNDLVFRGLQLAGLAGLFLLDRRHGGSGGWLSARNVFFAIACSALAGSAVGLWQVRSHLGRSLAGARECLRENWRFGRWLLGSSLGNFVLIRANNFIVAGFVGVAGAAMLEAPRLLLAPLQVLAMGGNNVLVPRAAEKYEKGGRKGLLGFLVPAAVVLAVIFIGYAAVVAAAPGFWLRLFFGGRYDGAGTIVVLWAASYAVSGLHVLPRVGLVATRRPDLLMYALLGTAALLLAASTCLSATYGLHGALVAKLGSSIILLGGLALLCRRALGRVGATRE